MKFHDDTFAGVKLEIPCLRTDDNAEVLDNAFQKIRRIIDNEIIPNAKFSRHHPTWQRNRAELEEYPLKAEKIAKERERQKQLREKGQLRAEQREQYLRFACVDVEDAETAWNEDQFFIGGDCYEYEDMFNKTSIKKSFLDEVHSKYTDREILQAIIDDQLFHNYFQFDFHPDDVTVPSKFAYHTTYATLGLRINRRILHVFDRNKVNDNGYYFYKCPIFYDYERKERFIDISGRFDRDHRIADHECVEVIDEMKTRNGVTRNKVFFWLGDYVLKENFPAKEYVHKSIAD